MATSTKISTPRKIWVCPACGKWADDKKHLYDVSCYIHAIQVNYDSCIFKDGRVTEVTDSGSNKDTNGDTANRA